MSATVSRAAVPLAFVTAAADRYPHRVPDFIPAQAFARVRLDLALGRSISAAYASASRCDDRAFRAYAAFIDQTVRQFRFLIGRVEFGGLGLSVRFVDEDPYCDVDSMLRDLRDRRLKVFASAATGNPHPYLSDGENDMFRAVHDVFGHAACGRGFDPDGEEAAWVKHCAMYTGLARRALTTETRGQNCAQLFHYDGAFPEQKAVLLPRVFSDPSAVQWSEASC